VGSGAAAAEAMLSPGSHARAPEQMTPSSFANSPGQAEGWGSMGRPSGEQQEPAPGHKSWAHPGDKAGDK